MTHGVSATSQSLLYHQCNLEDVILKNLEEEQRYPKIGIAAMQQLQEEEMAVMCLPSYKHHLCSTQILIAIAPYT